MLPSSLNEKDGQTAKSDVLCLLLWMIYLQISAFFVATYAWAAMLVLALKNLCCSWNYLYIIIGRDLTYRLTGLT